IDLTMLRNDLSSEEGFRRSGSELAPAEGFDGSPVRKFLRLEPIRTAPDEPDLGLTFEREQACKLIEGLGDGDAVVPFWANDDAGFRVLGASERGISSNPKVTLPAFPTGKGGKPGLDGILALPGSPPEGKGDSSGIARTDFVLAGAGGVAFARQN